MALKAADMTSCKDKRKCLNGPNKGLAYDPTDPCAYGSVFNSTTCNCDVVFGCSSTRSANVYWKVSYATFASGCNPTTTLCFNFGDTPYSLNVTDLAIGGTIEFTTIGNGTIGTCSGSEGTTPAIVYPACLSGSVYFRVRSIGSPGCSVNTSAGAIATIYDSSIVYL